MPYTCFVEVNHYKDKAIDWRSIYYSLLQDQTCEVERRRSRLFLRAQCSFGSRLDPRCCARARLLHARDPSLLERSPWKWLQYDLQDHSILLWEAPAMFRVCNPWRSFYGRLFPSESIHFVYSATSLHRLSQVLSPRNALHTVIITSN